MSGGRLAIFDIDGTLLRSTEVDDLCFLRAFEEEFGVRDVETDWSSYPECTDPAVARVILRSALGRDPEPEETRRVERRFVRLLEAAGRRSAARYAEVPGARRLFELLLGTPGWSVALATGAWAGSARCKLAVSGFDRFDLPLATAADSPERVGIVRAAWERAAARDGTRSFSRVVAVGDGPWDVRAAAALGMPFVGVGAGERAGRLERAGARHVVADYRPPESFLRLLETARPPGPVR